MSLRSCDGLRRPWRDLCLAAVLLLTGSHELLAHNVTPEPTVDVFLRPAGDRLIVKVWLPIVALTDANLPRTPDGHFLSDQIRPALDLVARGIARDLQLQQDDRPLSASMVTTTFSPDESFVAVDLEYPASGARPDFSGRFHTFRGNGQIVTTRVHYILDDHTTRTFAVDGEPLRIAFAPGVMDVAKHFIDQGINVLFDSADFLLFAVCLMAIGRPQRTTAVAVTAFLAGQILAIILAAMGVVSFSPFAVTLAAALAASTIVIVAIQDVASPQSRWLPVLSFAFGSLIAGMAASRLLHEWGFVGTHPSVGLIGFITTVAFGEVWVITLLTSAAGLIRRRGRVAELVVLSAAIFAGHAALHRIVDQAQTLADAGAITLDRFLFTLTVVWAALILCAGIIDALLRVKERGPAFTPRKLEAQ